jgi:hypothetical protein
VVSRRTERHVAPAIAALYVVTALQPAAALDPPATERTPWAQTTSDASGEPLPLPPPAPAADGGEIETPASRQRRWVMPERRTGNLNAPTGGPDPQGSFILELSGALIGMLIGGGVLTLGLVLALDDSNQNCNGSCGFLLVSGAALVFFGPPMGVTIAGNASGGQGSFGWSLVGTLGGVTLSLPGMIAGAIIGYRASAPDEPVAPAVSLGPTPDLHGLQLQVGARF